MAATVAVEPAGRSLWDEPVRIRAWGLSPGQRVTLRASLRDEKDALFRAHARYCADAGGRLDLARSPALGGSFAGLEPMGLLWALEPDKPQWRLVKRDVQTPLVVELEVLEGHDPEPGRLLGRTLHERHFLGPGVRREPVRLGRVLGTLFLPPGPGPFPGIIDLFGLEMGLVEYQASLLASHGFAALALAYQFEDLPIKLDSIQLDYFEEALCYMLQHAKVRSSGIGLLGISLGADICLAMASFMKNITATVSINGSGVCGCFPIYHHKQICVPLRDPDLRRAKTSFSGMLDIVDIWPDIIDIRDSPHLIPIEKTEGPILFIVGEDDHNWRSEFNAQRASERLQAYGKEKPQIISYPGAGHYIEPPYFPLCPSFTLRQMKTSMVWGGEPRAHSKAQVDAWKKILAFFCKHLGGITKTSSRL
ncbi:peroxisomal succinyl-coenzyme A thioesterase-like isoform X15 [Suncus etruscus]|uniref:peroxisomal succinyl-coenzyme A thioesterase-like isoform X15 n=1 Tax=Suncus etruscus TaxID=109475 RepID=UPI0021105FF8|nr:peroxisomal succinyl-coenzyme A thioesterase-like isoform X15 [Suncus etruscus]